ncbi:helix-turn-helix transcriptional regulator [Pseudobdellovibrio exovorus]|uniref:HTH cro/C1-type domain-containing protein n=1 Tax=Pseudobdellovibrio exovorus JSS TaxID=1184267 RepID=M4V554_9BACT|nr:helix-turn-helix transcriptional regulator [Pseudobdellovibrio exovorus]AGH94318.1 hypothetical protein A11Q_98 [Pseudobdellovibrio exovorus JSS]
MRKDFASDRKIQSENFRELLKKRRLELGLTQAQLAERISITVDMVRAIEGGRSCNPSFFLAVDIFKALELDLGETIKLWAGK